MAYVHQKHCKKKKICARTIVVALEPHCLKLFVHHFVRFSDVTGINYDVAMAMQKAIVANGDNNGDPIEFQVDFLAFFALCSVCLEEFLFRFF